MPNASSLFFLQKVTSGNILGIGRKFTRIFIGQMKTGAERAALGAAHRPGVGPIRGLGPTSCQGSPCPSDDASTPFNAYKFTRDLKVTSPEGFFPGTQQSSAAIADKFWGSDCSCSGTLPGRGSTSGSHLHQHRASCDKEGVVPRRG